MSYSHRVKIFSVDTPPFNNKVIFCVGGTKEYIERWLRRKFKDCPTGVLEDVNFYNANGTTVYFKGGISLVHLLRYKKSYNGTLIHEIVHAAHNILDYAGVKITQDNDEIMAYLVEYLFVNALKKL